MPKSRNQWIYNTYEASQIFNHYNWKERTWFYIQNKQKRTYDFNAYLAAAKTFWVVHEYSDLMA